MRVQNQVVRLRGLRIAHAERGAADGISTCTSCMTS